MNIRNIYTLIGNASLLGVVWVSGLPVSWKLIVTAFWSFSVSYTYGAVELEKSRKISQSINKEWESKLKSLKEIAQLGEDLKKEIDDDKNESK